MDKARHRKPPKFTRESPSALRRSGQGRGRRWGPVPGGWHKLRWLAVFALVLALAGGVVRSLDRAAHGDDWVWLDRGDGTITDLISRRTWQQAGSAEGIPFDKAARYCATLQLAGHRDWRAPERTELESLVNPWRPEGQRCPPGFRNDAKLFWSGTRHDEHAWAINCASGDRWHYQTNSLFRVRCVR